MSRQFAPAIRPDRAGSPPVTRPSFADVGRADDAEERVADRMADQALRSGSHSPTPEPAAGPARAATTSHGAAAALGPGQPLDAAERRHFEPRFGFSFDRIRVHSGPEAARSALSVGASAYALGNDVVFGSGHYRPGTSEGRALLAHELAHVARTYAGADAARPVIRRADLKATAVVLDDNTDLLDAPSGKNVVATLNKGDVVEVTGEDGNFYGVSANGKAGFVDHRRLDLPASPSAKHRPDSTYQGIVQRARTTLTIADGERFYHLDDTFGANLLRFARSKRGLPAGFAGDGGWLTKHLRGPFKQVGWKKGDTFRALITYKEHHLLVGLTKHPGRYVDGKFEGPVVEEGLEATFLQPDWEKRLTDNKVMPP